MTNQCKLRRSSTAKTIWLLVQVLCLSASETLHAQGSDSYPTLPNRGRGPLLIRATLSTSETAGHVVFDIKSGAPSKAERQLELVVYLSNGNGSNRAVRKNVVFPQGATSINERIHFSQSVANGAWDTGVFEGGRDLEDRRKQTNLANSNINWWNVNNLSATTFIYDPNRKGETPEFNALANEGNNFNSIFSSLWNSTRFQLDEVPNRWADLIQYSLCVIHAETLERLKQSRPEAFASLVNYMYAGGKLLVLDANQLGGLANFEAIFEIQNGDSNSLKALQSAKERWWTIYRDEIGRTEETPDTSSGFSASNPQLGQSRNRMPQPAENVADDEEQSVISLSGVLADASLAAETYLQVEFVNHFDTLLDIADSLDIDVLEWEVAYSNKRYIALQNLQSETFYSRPFGFGELIIVPRKSSDLSRKTRKDILSHALLATSTSRFSLSSDGNWMWLNLIESVGKPPVWTFCLAVALFSLFLGPGLLFLTGRKKRRSLMMFLVPAVSCLAAMLILAYNVVYEGFDTYIRTCSLQMINDNDDQSFVWSRQNFFSGLPPRQGLEFEQDVFARPVSAKENVYYGGDLRRNIEWTALWNPSSSLVWKNWLAARQQQQVLLGHPAPPAKVPFTVKRLDGAEVEVTNTSQKTLPLVVFRGGADDYYWLDDLPPGESRTVEVADVAAAGANVSRIMDDYRPKPPPELKSSSTLYEYASGRSSNYLNDDANDLIQSYLRQRFSDKLMLPKFGYATFNRDTSAAYKPLEGIAEQSDLNLIVGRLQW